MSRQVPISRRQFLKGAATVAGAAALSACQPVVAPAPAAAPTTAPAAIAQPSRPAMMRVAYATDINFLDPALMQSAPEWMPSYLIYDPLVRYDQTMLDPKPALAESWTRSDDGKTWVFQIRQGVKYHTGREMKAEDIAYSWRRAIDVGPKGRAAGFLIDVDTFEVTGDYELTVNLKAFSWNFFPNCASMAVVVVDQETIDQITNEPIGTGPYRLAEWSPGESITYEKFGDYWDQERLARLPDQIRTIVIPELQTSIANLKTGDVDVVSAVSPQFVPDLEATEGIQLIRQAPFSAAYNCFDFGLVDSPFEGNVKLRQAVARAIDRETINKNAYFGLGEVDCNLIPTTHWAYTPLDCEPLSYNLDAAKALLAEAGFPDGFEFTCITHTRDPLFVRAPEIIQEDLRKIGVEMKIEALDFSLYVQDYWVPKVGDAMLAGYTREPDPDGLFSSVLRKDQGNNWMRYYNEEVEELFDLGKAELEQQARIPHYEKIMQIAILQDIPLVKLHTRAEIWAANEHVQGLALVPKGYPNLWDWEWV